MARRTFDVIDVTEILMHWHAGRSKNEMAAEPGGGPQDAAEVHRPGGGGGHRPGRAGEERGRSGRSWCGSWFPELADTRLRQVTWPAIGGHHEYITGAAEGRGADVDDPPAAAGRARPGRQRGELPPVCRGERAGGDPPVAGDGVEPAAGRGRGAGADRLRAAGPLAGPGDREAAHGLGVRDGAGVLAAHVRAAGAEDGPAGLDRVPRRGVRVLRRRPGPAGPGQPEDRGGQAGPV